MKKGSKFSQLPTVRVEVAETPPPPSPRTVSLTIKYPCFFMTSLGINLHTLCFSFVRCVCTLTMLQCLFYEFVLNFTFFFTQFALSKYCKHCVIYCITSQIIVYHRVDQKMISLWVGPVSSIWLFLLP